MVEICKIKSLRIQIHSGMTLMPLVLTRYSYIYSKYHNIPTYLVGRIIQENQNIKARLSGERIVILIIPVKTYNWDAHDSQTFPCVDINAV